MVFFVAPDLGWTASLSISLYFVFVFLNENFSEAEIWQICVFAKGYITGAIRGPGITGEVLTKYWRSTGEPRGRGGSFFNFTGEVLAKYRRNQPFRIVPEMCF